MSVRYKFKNTLCPFDTITFDGNSISLSDFKKTVMREKNLSKTDDDLKVVIAETKQELKLNDVIPKNTSVIVSRIPRTPQSKKPMVDKRTLAAKTDVKKVEPLVDKGILDLSKLNISEEKKIDVMMEQSTAVYNQNQISYSKMSCNAQTSQVPKNYRCNRCYLSGHLIKDCPVAIMNKLKITENRKKAGIPKAFQRNECEKENTLLRALLFDDKPADVRNDLLCPICVEVFVDAVMMACCGSSFCDDCVRNALLDSTDNKCPACEEAGVSPDSLIPNRYLRKSAQIFKSKSGLMVGSVIGTKNKQEKINESVAKNALDRKEMS